MNTTPYYIERKANADSWLLRDWQDRLVMEVLHVESAKQYRDLLNEAFQAGFSHCIDMTEVAARELDAARDRKLQQAIQTGVAEMTLAAGTDQPLVVTGPGGDFQKSFTPARQPGIFAQAIAKVKRLWQEIKESGNA